MPKKIITQNSLPHILQIINTWNGKLTWDLLSKRVALDLNIKDGVQRQSLSSYKVIHDTYIKRALILKEGSLTSTFPEDTDETIKYLSQQVAALKIQLELANSLNESYKQRFILWQFNAYQHGVRIASLDNEPIDKLALKKLKDMLEKPLTEVKRRTGGK